MNGISINSTQYIFHVFDLLRMAPSQPKESAYYKHSFDPFVNAILVLPVYTIRCAGLLIENSHLTLYELIINFKLLVMQSWFELI